MILRRFVRATLLCLVMVSLAGCGIGRTGRLFLAELALAATVAAASNYDGSLDRAGEGIEDRRFVCSTDDGRVRRISALGTDAARARCEHEERVRCSCGTTWRDARTSTPPVEHTIGFADEPWPEPREAPERAGDLAPPAPGVSTSGAEAP